MSDSSGERYVIEARLLGVDESCANKKRQRKSEMEFAIDVTLSDESSYVIFRTVRQITVLHVSAYIYHHTLRSFHFSPFRKRWSVLVSF
jgi:hypothetical protein